MSTSSAPGAARVPAVMMRATVVTATTTQP